MFGKRTKIPFEDIHPARTHTNFTYRSFPTKIPTGYCSWQRCGGSEDRLDSAGYEPLLPTMQAGGVISHGWLQVQRRAGEHGAPDDGAGLLGWPCMLGAEQGSSQEGQEDHLGVSWAEGSCRGWKSWCSSLRSLCCSTRYIRLVLLSCSGSVFYSSRLPTKWNDNAMNWS